MFVTTAAAHILALVSKEVLSIHQQCWLHKAARTRVMVDLPMTASDLKCVL